MPQLPRKKSLWILLLAVGGFLFAAAPAPGAERETAQYIIRIATIAPEGSYWNDFFQKARSYVESRSRGRAKIVWYMSGVMGDESEVIKKIEAGRLEGSVLTILGLGLIQPAFRATMLPFLLQNYGEVDYIFDSMSPKFAGLLREKGYILMGFTEVGFNHLFTQTPLRSPKDFPGLKMWAWKGEKLIDLIFRDHYGLKTLVPLTLYEVKSALEKGTINSYYSPCYAPIGLQWYQHARYMTDFGFGYTPGVFIMDKKYFSSLPADIQSILRQAFDFIMKPLRTIIREEEEKACRGLIQRGIIRTKASPEFLEELNRISQEVNFQYAGQEYPRELIQEITDRLKEFRNR